MLEKSKVRTVHNHVKIIAIGIAAAVATADAQILTITTRLDKVEFAFYEPIDITSEIRGSGYPPRQLDLMSTSGNLVYEVEYQFYGTFLPVKQSLVGQRGFSRAAKGGLVSNDDAPAIATMDLRILFHFADAGRYRVRGKYRLERRRDSTFDKISDWSEFEIRPKTEREEAIYQELELTGGGNTDAERLASYEAFAAKYPKDYLTAAVYRIMLRYYLRAGHEARALSFLKEIIDYQNISKIERLRYAYEIAGLEEKTGHMDEAVQWYRQSGLLDSEERIEKLQGQAQ